MSTKTNQSLGQLLMVGVSGYSLTNEEKTFLVQNNIGGVILFARNIKEAEQVHSLCSEIQSLRHQLPDKTPFFIGTDMEGGRVHRLPPPFTQWPSMKKLGDLDYPTASFYLAQYMGTEMRSVGINLDFAPCSDVFTNPLNKVIGDRALSSDPEMVSKHLSALIRGFLKSDMISCAKHFPGHGNTLVDSHHGLPEEEASMERLESLELIPFKRAAKAKVDMIMSSHILFKNIDPEWPVTLSKIFIKKILREEIRFRGVIVSDDLGMKALSEKYTVPEITIRGLQAGLDLLLFCNDPEAPLLAMEALRKAYENKEIDSDEIGNSLKRISELKTEKLGRPDPEDIKKVVHYIGHPTHFKLAQAIQKGEMPLGLLP